MNLLQQKLPASKYDSKNKFEESDEDYNEDFEKDDYEKLRRVINIYHCYNYFRNQEIVKETKVRVK